jgi:hypothetical protein
MAVDERVSTFIVSLADGERYRYDLQGGVGIAAADPITFTDLLLDHIDQLRGQGHTVRIEQGSPPLPSYLFPPDYV